MGKFDGQLLRRALSVLLLINRRNWMTPYSMNLLFA